MRKALYILLTALAGLLLSATAVYAVGWRYIPEPPEFTVVRQGEVIQKAHLKGYHWTVWGKPGRWYERRRQDHGGCYVARQGRLQILEARPCPYHVVFRA